MLIAISETELEINKYVLKVFYSKIDSSSYSQHLWESEKKIVFYLNNIYSWFNRWLLKVVCWFFVAYYNRWNLYLNGKIATLKKFENFLI